jgi:hypothetical protein
MSSQRQPFRPPGRLYDFASLAFVVGAIVLAWPWLSGAVTIPWDAKAQAYPQIVFLARALAAGDSPFWTPNVFAGFPQIADPQSQIFSPPFFLLALFNSAPSFRAVDAVVFGMLVLAGLALIAFFRDRGWHPAGALVTAFAFSFGGSAAWRLQHIGEVISLCWFALTLLALSRALKRSSLLYGLAAGVLAGFMTLGRDQIALLCIFILAAFAMWQVWDGRGMRRRLLRALPPLTTGFIGGLLTVVIPIAFTLYLADDSNRPGMDFEEAARGSLPPLALLSAVVSNLFGVDGPMKDFWGPPSSLVWGETDLTLARNMGAIYFGAIPLVALACAAGVLRDRGVRIFLAMMIFMLLYAVGRYTPFFQFAFWIPGGELYRRPADATFPLCALLAILAGYGVHGIVARGERVRMKTGALVIGLLFALCLLVAFEKGHLAQAQGALMIGAVSLTMAVAVLFLAPRVMSRAPYLGLAALAALMTLDLAISNKPNESTGLPPATYDELHPDSTNETLAIIRDRLAAHTAPDRRDRVELAAVDYEWPNMGLVQGFDHDLGFNPIRLKLFTDATNAQDQVSVPEERTFSPLYAHFRSPLADLLGVRLIVSRFPLERMDKAFDPKDFTFIGHTKDAFVWENPHALPRVMAPGAAQITDIERMLTEGDWPQVDFTRTVLLDGDEAGALLQGPPGEAKILSYRNTEVLVEARSPQGCYLVLNDIWHSWWTAKVDGVPAPILQANVMFRAVRLGPGAHQVRFSFDPFAGLWAQIWK